VFQAHRLVYHSTPGLRVIKKKKKKFGFWRGGWTVLWVVRVVGDDGELRPWHYIYVYSIESRLIMRVRYGSHVYRLGRLVFKAHIFGGLVFKAHRLVYHSTLGLRVIKKKKMKRGGLDRLGFVVGDAFESLASLLLFGCRVLPRDPATTGVPRS